MTQKEGQNLKALLAEERAKFAKEEIFPLFSTAYFIAKQDFAFADGEDLLKFLNFHQVKIPTRYRNTEAVREAIAHISSSIQAQILEDLNECSTFNLQMDELNDISFTKVLTLNIRYVVRGVPVSRFLGLIKLVDQDGKSIYQTVKKTLKDMKIYEKLGSVCTDGGSSFCGINKGAIKRLTVNLPKLLSIHCISHRLNLCVIDLWKGDKVLNQINQSVYNLCKLFSNSSNRLKLLKDNEQKMLNKELHLIRPIDIRWMSKFYAIKRIILLYPALIRSLVQLVIQKNLNATCSYIQMVEFKTVAHLAILSDISYY